MQGRSDFCQLPMSKVARSISFRMARSLHLQSSASSMCKLPCICNASGAIESLRFGPESIPASSEQVHAYMEAHHLAKQPHLFTSWLLLPPTFPIPRGEPLSLSYPWIPSHLPPRKLLLDAGQSDPLRVPHVLWSTSFPSPFRT